MIEITHSPRSWICWRNRCGACEPARRRNAPARSSSGGWPSPRRCPPQWRVKAGRSLAGEGRRSLPDGARRHVPCSPRNWRSAGAGSTIVGCLPSSLGHFTSAARAAGPADGLAGAAPLPPGRQRYDPHSRRAQDRSPAP